VVVRRADVDDVPTEHDWLTERERTVLRALRVPKRRTDWRLGRWAAKEAVVGAVGAAWLPRACIEILATTGGRPVARIHHPGAWPRVALSLSHAGDTGFAAALRGPAPLGCDVEQVTERSQEFVNDYFTADEAAWIRSVPGESALRANLLWSAKESALKALGEGLRMDPRCVPVVATGAGDGFALVPHGGSLSVGGPGRRFLGRWWCTGPLVWTVVSDRARELDGLAAGLPPRSAPS